MKLTCLTGGSHVRKYKMLGPRCALKEAKSSSLWGNSYHWLTLEDYTNDPMAFNIVNSTGSGTPSYRYSPDRSWRLNSCLQFDRYAIASLERGPPI